MNRSVAYPSTVASAVLVTASLIIVTPVAAPSPETARLPDIALTAGPIDLLDPLLQWGNVLLTTGEDLRAPFDQWSSAPFPILQQLLVNLVDNVKGLLSGNVGEVFTNIEQHAEAALAAPFGADVNLLQQTDGFLNECFNGGCQDVSSIFGHQEMFESMSNATDSPVFDFTASPMSGLLLGVFGPVVAPFVALYQAVQSTITDLTGSNVDLGSAVIGVLNIPADMTAGFLYGATDTLSIPDLPVGSLLGIPDSVFLNGDVGGLIWPSDGLTFQVDNSMALGVGGLLSPAGSLFNALAIDTSHEAVVNGSTFTNDVLPESVGPTNALIALTQAIAEGLGWDGDGSPIDALGDLFSVF